MSHVVNNYSAGRFRLPAESEKDARTLGSRLRRALLNDTTGTAATAVKIEGAAHEFQALPGVREDALQLIQRIKRVRLGATSNGSLKGAIDSTNAVVTAGEIKIGGAEIANPDHVLAHLSPGARVRVEIAFERGTGYRAAGNAPEGFIPIEADFCPVKRVSVRVIADALELEVETDGSVTPESALAEAMALVDEQRAFEALPEEPRKSTPVVELGHEFHGDPFMGVEPPPALGLQVDSYREFLDQGIPRLLDRLFPLIGRALGNGADQSLPGRTSERGRKIEIISHRLEMPADTPEDSVREHRNYEARLFVKVRIDRPDGGYDFDYTTVGTEEIDMGTIPLMTADASFIINGAHRCCVMLGDGGYGVLRVGELLTRELERLIDQMKPFLEDRMDLVGELRGDILNLLPLSATVRELLTSSMWSQYSDETNPLAALTHRTRLSRLPAVTNLPADARDIKMSDFGRLCYLETPEGPNIGFISTLCTYAKLNEAGEIVTPYRKVAKGKAGKEIVYLTAAEEAASKIADVVDLTTDGSFRDDYLLVREASEIRRVPVAEVELVSISPIQGLSRSSAMIPFLGHNEPGRSLMGSNMQRQALPLIDPEQPLVKSGVEANAARDSGQLVTARRAGKVIEATGGRIVVATGGERDVYELAKFRRTNQATCINQTPVVTAGQEVATGDVLADTGATRDGELALGRNVLVAYMPFRGFNFEDAICISDELVREDAFTSIHLEWLQAEVGDSDAWIAPVGTRLAPGDVMVQEASGRKKPIMVAPPPGDSVLVQCARHGGRVKLTFAMKRSMSVGDKFAGRHGNKGCIARILPRSEMPYLDDGTPVQMVLNPLGVVSRIDLGQILETHFGALAHALGTQFVIPPFTGPSTEALRDALSKAGLSETGMATLYDGATGRAFDSPVTVGYLYMMKLAHRAEDKMNAYSTAATSAGQTAVRGTWGQRAGFLELWALEAYNAGATLQEFLTVKAEDAPGREKTALALLAGEEIDPPSEGGSLELLENALRGVGIKVEEKR